MMATWCHEVVLDDGHMVSRDSTGCWPHGVMT